MSTDIFSPAIAEMKTNSLEVFGPTSFQRYLSQNNLPKKGTASSISIDTFERLPSILKEYEIMVFRLGLAKGSNKRETKFALVNKPIKDFFLFADQPSLGTTYLPKVSIRDLFAYQVLPIFSETSLVNLALASGLLSYALELDQEGSILNPATGRSIYTFELQLHSSIETVYMHEEGQIEIDSLFIGRRNSKEVLFLLEAKQTVRSLAKHKLVYPLLAIADRVPSDIDIVPVYMNIGKSSSGFHFHVFECHIPDPRKEMIAIDQLEVKKSSHLTLPNLFNG